MDPSNRHRRRRRRNRRGPGVVAPTSPGATAPIPSSGRRSSLIVLSISIPLVLVILFYQHVQLLQSLEGGGEYTIDQGDSGWSQSLQQVKEVIEFVAYGSVADDDDEVDGSGLSEDEPAERDSFSQDLSFDDGELEGSIVPYDLSVNHLKLVKEAPGRPPPQTYSSYATTARREEDFLPVVSTSDLSFRWRLRSKAGANVKTVARATAYRIIARRCNGFNRQILWDTDKAAVASGDPPDHVRWPHTELPQIGEIIEWRVIVWDTQDRPHTSNWSRLAIGPRKKDDWLANFIVHPDDMKTFDGPPHDDQRRQCDLWHKRRSLPLFRANIRATELTEALKDDDELVSALLVVSGLGSFRVSFNGVPLSASGPIDPPFTDYTKRVMYRGFDVTKFLQEGKYYTSDISHVVGIETGSGWWDHRPVSGSAIVQLDLLPRGPVTVIAQLYLRTLSGKQHVLIPTSTSNGAWQVTRGHIRESDLFLGEIVDLKMQEDLEGWDTPAHQQLEDKSKVVWTTPVEYRTDITLQSRYNELSKRAGAYRDEDNRGPVPEEIQGYAAPIGRLEPSAIPPILPMERIEPDEVHYLTNGRWLVDFGKSVSGMLHFSEGLPEPIVKDTYPRAHGYGTQGDESFVTVVYGESLEMTTGDINRVLVAGMGLHDGGPRHVSQSEGAQDNNACFPNDHDHTLTQRDVYVYPGNLSDEGAKSRFAKARQSHFTTHAFRFAEICCTDTPPSGVSALAYRTAMSEWGSFDSSNVLLNGGYELVKNAMKSNFLSVQSDCPHREKLPYGGDLVANSPAAMHMFDMSAFYKKTIRDWIDGQWQSGAYTETSIWQDLNDYAGIGKGAGETVWASAPPVLTVRHMQHYGDKDLLAETLSGHIHWMQFLNKEFDRGLEKRGYHKWLKGYEGEGAGLGDWLALRTKDTWLTHTAFYMASARAVAYIARKLESDVHEKKAMSLAKSLESKISSLYFKNRKDSFDFPEGHDYASPGPELGLFTRIVPAAKRCAVLKNWFKRPGSVWPGDEERLFLNEVDKKYLQDMVRSGELVRESDGKLYMGWSQWQGFNEGILAIRYSLKTLSEFGFHNVALRKATGFGFGTPEYMLRHNATSLWETWWRSEDLYSRNHPMLGAFAEWMSSSVAGISHHPRTTGGRTMLFSPRFPKSAAMLSHASSEQGTPVGDYAIAWRFEDLPENKNQYNSAVVKIRIRLMIPPTAKGVLELPLTASKGARITISKSTQVPDIEAARAESRVKCSRRRRKRLGFPFSWEYDKDKRKWYRLESGKSIGTPCESFLFDVLPVQAAWSGHADMTDHALQGKETVLNSGLYEILMSNWQLEREVEGRGRLGNLPEYFRTDELGPYCQDEKTGQWDVEDATHMI